MDGVPNLLTVTPGHLYRGGQPTVSGWSFLHDTFHIRTVIKLNAPSESFEQNNDAPAVALGMNVVVVTMHPVGGYNPVELLLGPSQEQIDQVMQAITTAPGPVYIHCSHGRDRTGLMVALHRIWHEHYSVHEARLEMLHAGYRVENLGLDRVWFKFTQDLP